MKSVAVLPFVNMSGDPANEYFSDGITEEILNAIAHLPGLRVAARTSSFAYKGKNEDIAAIARNLRVNNVLEGSVQRMGDRIRVTAQLIDASSGLHLWSERFDDRDTKDLFKVQDEIAQAIARALKLTFEGRRTKCPERNGEPGELRPLSEGARCDRQQTRCAGSARVHRPGDRLGPEVCRGLCLKGETPQQHGVLVHHHLQCGV